MNRNIFRIKVIFIFLLGVVSFSSCLVSSRSNVDVFNKNEYSGTVSVKSIKVPMLIGKPFLKKYLRCEEDVPKEVVDLISGLKRIRVTLAQTTNEKLVSEFRTSVNELFGEEWLSVHNGSQWIYLRGHQDEQDVIKRITVAISAPEANQLVYVNMKCNLTPNQLSRLINFAMDSDEGKKFFKEGIKNKK
ncbi:MAG: hypothetical protein ABIN25_03710 [Ginsengibacter sp.]